MCHLNITDDPTSGKRKIWRALPCSLGRITWPHPSMWCPESAVPLYAWETGIPSQSFVSTYIPRLLQMDWCDTQIASSERFSQVFTFSHPCYWKDWCWSRNSNTLATWYEELTHLKRPWYWERLKAGGEGDDRGWDGWMASPTQQTWVWVNSRSWWWTGKPGVLQSMGSKSVRHNWVTELNWKL